jgi:type IX secretion system PorP/SprF family membrane protein
MASLNTKGQDPIFSQFYVNSLYYNPAAAGTAGMPRMILHYRNQFPSLGNAFTTYNIGYDQPVEKIHGGLGFALTHDRLNNGVITNTSFDFLYSYRINVSRKFRVHTGLQASFLYNSLNTSSLNSTAIARDAAVEMPTVMQPDFSIGILGMSRNLQIGASAHHLNTGYMKFNYSYINYPIKFSFFATRAIHISNPNVVNSKELIVSPAILVEKQGESLQANYGIAFTRSILTAGVWMRQTFPSQFNNIIFSLAVTLNNTVIGYSYDYNAPSLSYSAMPMTGAHEVTIVFLFKPDPTKGRFGPIKCPDFFIE